MLQQELIPERMVDMLMIELQTGSPFETQSKSNSKNPVHLVAIAKAFLEICDDSEEEDAFWLFVNYIKMCKVPLIDYLPDISQVVCLLQQHIPETYNHLIKFGVDMEAIFQPWLSSHFAGVLYTQMLEGVWDISVGGEAGIFPFIALSIISNCQRKIVACKTSNEVYTLLKHVFCF
jgi:hypothetical protein